MAIIKPELIACGGLNQQWGEMKSRRVLGAYAVFMYILKYRSSGAGRQLLAHLEKCARPNFSALCLNTADLSAASFYQKQNYVFVEIT